MQQKLDIKKVYEEVSDNKKIESLKPCKCGNKVKVYANFAWINKPYSVYCKECGMCADHADYSDQAILNWNNKIEQERT